ncbi:TolC family protein [Methylocystis sp. WRRC1]|uniref:TolC family protein n=1 Tax=Methylocystis sp. WRRC1 TaxID=1732014 RepID=UPI001D15E0DE|nr:TolC family protein [Methylocystis sp. WRRC1]MCC3246996.1 TolC family protein [Methylocystis sp. WRRC1]
MTIRSAFLPLLLFIGLYATASRAGPDEQPSGEVTVKAAKDPAASGGKGAKARAGKSSKVTVNRAKKTPLGHVLVRHLDMAVAIDAQSKALEAQFGAVSARYATANSITPGSPYFGGSQRNAAAGNLRHYNETEIEAGMPLWLPGQRDAYAATVSSGVVEVEERLSQRRLEVAGLLRDAWWNAKRAERDVSVARTRVATAREIGADMTRRVELGDAAEADALLARNETLAAETELAQAEGAAKVARVNYAALTGGTPPDGTLEAVRRDGDLEDHPALRAPLAALARAESQARLIDATPIDNPEIGVFGRQEHNDQYSTDPSQEVTNQRTDATTVGVRFRIPLPTPGRNEPRQAEAAAEVTRARAEYERAKRMVVAEIKAARTALAAAQKAAGLADKRLAVANEQFELSRKSFALGEISAFDLYRVRQIQLEAQRMQAGAAINVGVAVSRVNQALGYAP